MDNLEPYSYYDDYLDPNQRIQYSQAISLKRIADALEKQNQLTELIIDKARKY